MDVFDFDSEFKELLEMGAIGVDLSDEAIVDYMRGQPLLVRKKIDEIEQAEPWPADADWEAVDSLVKLGRRLTTDDLKKLGLNPTTALVKVLAYVRASRTLLFMNRLLDEGGDEAEGEFLARCKEASSAEAEASMAFKLVLNRLLFLKRSLLLQRIYSPIRATRIMDALKTVSLQ